MSRHEAAKVISNIERVLVQNDGNIDAIEARQGSSDPLRRSVTERLHFSIIPSMRSYHIVGKVEPGTRLAFPKKLLARLMRMVSAPQSSFNQNTTAAVEVLAESTETVRSRLLALETTIKELRRQNTLLQAELREIRESGVRTASDAAPAAAAPRAPESEAETRARDFAYLEFQRAFRGEETFLRKRLSEYIGIIRESLPARELSARPRVLDLACGDGIFLELVRDEGWTGRGVDLNGALVEAAHERGLKVDLGDVLDWSRATEPACWDVITSFQFVEHLSSDALESLMAGIARLLAPGGIAVIETINPHTVMAMRWYHLDLTHRHPVMPETLSWLAEKAGLKVEGWSGVHPVEAEHRLPEGGDEHVRQGFQRLNEFLYGPQDYYLVARKPKQIEA